MNKTTSVYLDAVRFFAAMVVLFGHLSGSRFTAGLMWQTSRFMGEAVVVFFVLSGFVISHAVQHRDDTAGSYTLSRASRILSVAYPALALTFFLDALGHSLRPDLYSPSWGYEASGKAFQLLANAFFVNQIWFTDTPPGSDLPYWSLGFEVWYYAIFGLFLFARRKVLWVVLACLVVGPKILSMFPLWLMGVGAHRLCKTLALPRMPALCLWLGSFLVWVVLDTLTWRSGWPALPLGSAFDHLDLVHSYCVAVLFAVNLVGINALAKDLDGVSRKIEPWVRWPAGATFSLYLFHLPLAQFIIAVLPLAWGPGTVAGRMCVVLGTLTVVFLLAKISEHRKDIWRRALEFPGEKRPSTVPR